MRNYVDNIGRILNGTFSVRTSTYQADGKYVLARCYTPTYSNPFTIYKESTDIGRVTLDADLSYGGKVYDLNLENGLLILDIRDAANRNIPELTNFTAYDDTNLADTADLAGGKTDKDLYKGFLS